jgi:hypothetical protein
MKLRSLLGLAASILILLTGCKEPEGSSGGTSGAALYAYDSTSSAVFVWTDISALYSTTTATVAPTKQITSSVFSNKITTLAWGGVCLDSLHGYLYLVSETGSIVRVSNLRSQSGAVASNEVVSFSLADTGRLTSSTFGQVALDAPNDRLYITENGSSSTQIWVVNNASSQQQSASVSLQALHAAGDTGGTGVAAASGSVYAFLLNGDTVGNIVTYTGPRLRKGTATAFTDAGTLIGPATLLGKYGSLALDTGNGYLFVARHNTDASATTSPIQVFTTGSFGQSFNQAPSAQLGSATAQPDLRVLTHAGSKDWLAGLSGQGTTGYGKIHLWKSPMGGTAAKVVTASPTTAVFKGIAIDGNAS